MDIFPVQPDSATRLCFGGIFSQEILEKIRFCVLFASALCSFCHHHLDKEVVSAETLALQYFWNHLFQNSSPMRKV